MLTTVGAIPAPFGRHPSAGVRNGLLAFAAGAMLYVISREILPETLREGSEEIATAGLMAGLGVMMLLDVWLG